MKYAVIFLIGAAWASAARADVVVGIEQEVSPTVLKSIPTYIDQAFSRPEEEQASAVYFTVQDKLVLSCPPHRPDATGHGCNLLLLPKAPAGRGDVRISLRKSIVKTLVAAKALEAFDRVTATDPNTALGEMYFGNPLYTLPVGQVDGTHYYCIAEGEPSQKTWKCYLSVAETLSAPSNP